MTGEQEFDAARLRRLVKLCGLEKTVPESDETLLGCLGTVIGSICRVVEQRAVDSKRLDKVYRLAMVEPFIAPITTKETWLASIDAAIAKEPK